MNKKFSPLLVTTPRTGSSVICHYLGQIGKQTADYQNNLFEYFDLAPWNNLHYKVFKHFNKNIIGLETNENIVSLADNKFDVSTSLDYKFQQLKNNKFKYMIKLIPYNINDHIIEYCVDNYDFIYLERKNKLNQLLSFMAMMHTKTSHYEKNTNKIVKQFNFDLKLVNILNIVMSEYKKIKMKHEGPLIYYEDLFIPEFNLSSLLEKLELQDSVNTNMVINLDTTSTPYESNDLESLITNKEEYLRKKSEIIQIISHW